MEEQHPAKRYKRIDDRLQDVIAALEELDSVGTRPLRLDLIAPYKLKCGTQISRWTFRPTLNAARRRYQAAFDMELEGDLHMIEVGPTFASIDELAGFVRSFMDDAKLCKECHKIEFKHTCHTRLAGLIQGIGERDICSICMEDCIGITTTKCSHAFHASCLKKIRNNRCPNCRGVIDEEIEAFEDSDTEFANS